MTTKIVLFMTHAYWIPSKQNIFINDKARHLKMTSLHSYCFFFQRSNFYNLSVYLFVCFRINLNILQKTGLGFHSYGDGRISASKYFGYQYNIPTTHLNIIYTCVLDWAKKKKKKRLGIFHSIVKKKNWRFFWPSLLWYT